VQEPDTGARLVQLEPAAFNGEIKARFVLDDLAFSLNSIG
jgi:hypothetical protein